VWIGRMPLCMGLAAFLLFMLLNNAAFFSASHVKSERLYDQPSFEAARNRVGQTVVASRFQDGRLLSGGYSQYLKGTNAPQRISVDPNSHVFYIANYLGLEADAVTVFDGTAASSINLPGCRRAIDIAFQKQPPRVWTACEATQSLNVYDMEKKNRAASIPLGVLSYSMRVDEIRNRAYVSTAPGWLLAFDLTDFHQVGKRYLSLILANMDVDERTGNIWITQFHSGEVLVLDRDLRLLDRIADDVAPRDIAVDSARGFVLVGNYVTGTVTVIDSETREIRTVFRVDYPCLWPRLRGVSVAPDGKWLVSNGFGVWSFDAEDVLRATPPLSKDLPSSFSESLRLWWQFPFFG
jgi:DNA-binding beta-propeller fold protein YncE